MHPQHAVQPHLLRLADAGDAKPAWITLLTTEHYTLGMQRAATISEVNGRASIFIGAVSAGLIALGFEGAGSRHSAGSTVFAALVLTPLLFLGLVTFGRCLQIAIDDWEFSVRIMRLRAVYAQLVPELAGLLAEADTDEAEVTMFASRWQALQKMLSVAGSMAVFSSDANSSKFSSCAAPALSKMDMRDTTDVRVKFCPDSFAFVLRCQMSLLKFKAAAFLPS